MWALDPNLEPNCGVLSPFSRAPLETSLMSREEGQWKPGDFYSPVVVAESTGLRQPWMLCGLKAGSICSGLSRGLPLTLLLFLAVCPVLLRPASRSLFPSKEADT